MKLISTRIKLKLKIATSYILGAVVISTLNQSPKSYVVFANDCTLGLASAEYNNPLTSAASVWQDTNYVGVRNTTFQPSACGMMAVLKLIGILAIYSPVIFYSCVVFAFIALIVLKARVILGILSLVMTVSCVGLIIGLASGKIDSSISPWLAIFPISTCMLPLLIIGTITHLDTYDNT